MNVSTTEDFQAIEPAFSKEPSVKRKRDAVEDDLATVDLRRQKMDLDSRKIHIAQDRLDLLDKLVGRYHDICEAAEDPSANNIDGILKAKFKGMIEDA